MPGWLQDWWLAIAAVWTTVVGGFVGWVGWSIKQRFVTREALSAAIQAEHEERKMAVERAKSLAEKNAGRLNLVESRLADLPTHRDLDGIKASLAGLGATMTGVQAQLQGQSKQIDTVDGTVTRIHQYLLEQKT